MKIIHSFAKWLCKLNLYHSWEYLTADHRFCQCGAHEYLINTQVDQYWFRYRS